MNLGVYPFDGQAFSPKRYFTVVWFCLQRHNIKKASVCRSFLNYLSGVRTVLASCLGLEVLDENIEGQNLSPFFHSISFLRIRFRDIPAA